MARPPTPASIGAAPSVSRPLKRGAPRPQWVSPAAYRRRLRLMPRGTSLAGCADRHRRAVLAMPFPSHDAGHGRLL
jgi:hypothetical protein